MAVPASLLPSVGVSHSQSPNRQRLLLIEDSVAQARMVEGMLRTGGIEFDVTHVTSLSEAKRFLRDSRAACTLLDLTLPDADDLDGLIELRNIVPEIPIVVVTGDEDEARAVKAVQAGAQDYLIKGQMDSVQLCRSVRYAIERAHSELMLSHLALHDPLTGLPNRTLFLDRLGLALAQSERHIWKVGALFLDLDGFKHVNDRFGHGAGDAVLRTVAGRMLASVRPGDTVGRYGGDEFTTLHPEITRETDIVAIAKRLTEQVAKPVMVGGAEISLEISIGIALATGIRKPDAVIAVADEAMYRAKRREDANFDLVSIADGEPVADIAR